MADDQTKGLLTNDHSPDIQIPIVDFAEWKPEIPTEQRLKVAQDLISACRSVGFVYIINHGVPKETLHKAFEITKKLYDLPQEEKMKAPHPPGWAHHRGYSWPGLEKVSAALSEKDDEKMVEQLREVTDCKVWLSTPMPAHHFHRFC
jgi:isopenicillin N synthase-like dioxygenase